jgi:uncharacterized protein (DUF302 family)
VNNFSENGLVTYRSRMSVNETTGRLEELLQSKGMTIFSRIDHAEAARQVGMDLRPTILLVFGNPRAGTLIMQCAQSAAIDLPLKFLIWENEAGETLVSYSDPETIASRHNIRGCSEVLTNIGELIQSFAETVTAAV